jgi:plastocyanin
VNADQPITYPKVITMTGIRPLLTPVLLALSIAGAVPANLSGQAATDLHGTARAGDRLATDTVVWLEAPTAPSPPQGRVVLDQRNLSFSPGILVVRVGTMVDFPNDDRVFHNVFSFHDGKKFDLGLYPVGTTRRVKFDAPGVSRIFCNIHTAMAAYVMVVDSPFFARADESGAFTIAGVPAGTYTYHAWRPGAAAELDGTWSSASGPLNITWP